MYEYWSTVWRPPSFALNVSPLSSAKKKQAEKETTWPTQRNNLNNFSFELLQLCWWRQCYMWDLTPPKWALLFHAGQRRSLMCRSTSLYGWNSARLADMECLKLAIVSQSFYQIWLGKQAVRNLVLASLLCRRASQSLRDMYTTCQPRTLLHSARCSTNQTTINQKLGRGPWRMAQVRGVNPRLLGSEIHTWAASSPSSAASSPSSGPSERL